MNEELDDARIQAHLEAHKPLQTSEDVLAYQRLFAALKREPAIHPPAAFSMQVVNQVNLQRAAWAPMLFYWLLPGGVLLAFLSGLLWLFFYDQPVGVLVLWKAVWLAKEWLFVGLTCMITFSVLEHRLLHKKLINSSCA